MISPKTQTKVTPPRSFGWMAEYADEHQLLDACRKVRDSGYTRTDAFVPFPVHGIDEALGIRPTVLPWIVLAFGLTGTTLALLMQWWMNAVDYPYIISGKPFFSLPAFIPVMFEMTILFSVFSTFIAMILLNGLPRYNNPVFTNPKFDRSTDDRFFLWVDSRDKYFNSDKVKTLLESTHPISVEAVKEDESSDVVPTPVWRVLAALILITLIPASIAMRMRASKSEEPRLHVFFDMDFQPKKSAQDTSTIFADNRATRPPVAGTVARGDLVESDPYYLGYTPQDLALNVAPSAIRMVALQDEAPKGDEPPKSDEAPKSEDAPKSQDAPKSDDAAADKETPSSQEVPAAEASGGREVDAKPKDAPRPKPAGASPVTGNTVPQQSSSDPKQDTKQSKPAESGRGTAAAGDQPQSPAGDASARTQPSADRAVPIEGGPAAESTAATAPELPWVTDFPFEAADKQMMALGRLKYETNCALCHGFAGEGDGLVAQRASQLAQGYWVQPTSLHEPRVQEQPVGKIFHTITNGRGKMAPYGPVLTPKERWAVVLYVKALQRSRNATLEDVPEAQRAKLTAAPAK